MVYLPLDDGAYTVAAQPAGAQPIPPLKLSLMSSPPTIIGTPADSVSVTLAAGATTPTIYAHLREWDGHRVFANVLALKSRSAYTNRLEARWFPNIHDLRQQLPKTDPAVPFWVLPPYPSMVSWSILYGYLVESAGRHSLLPELLEAVFMGEGVGAPALKNGPIWSAYVNAHGKDPVPPPDAPALAVLRTFEQLGLDLYADNGRRPPPQAGDPCATKPWPPSNPFPFSNLDLKANGYLTDAVASNVHDFTVDCNELNRTWHATIHGYADAIEACAASIQARYDPTLQYCRDNGIVQDPTPDQIAYISYIRFNTKEPDGFKAHVNQLAAEMTPWNLIAINDREARCNALQRMAVAHWLADAGIYHQ
jgi:hypothetical protein